MRRRPVVVEKSPNIELLADDAGVSPVRKDRLTEGDGKDLSPSIRGETILDKSRDVVQIKKASANAATKPNRTRKVVSKPERPRWVTLISIFFKNLVLLSVILGLVQMIRKLALKYVDSLGGSLVVVPDFVRRIDEVESFVKTKMTMMHVHVDVVDKKIESEVNHRFEKLDSKSEMLEKKLGELRVMEFFSKEDLEKIFGDLMNVKGADNGDMKVSSDDIIMTTRDMLLKESQRLGRVDYALSSSGAMVVRHSEPFIIGKVRRWFRKISLTTVYRDSEKMLKPSFGEPGQCFPLKGDSGFVQIRLRTTIIPEVLWNMLTR